MKSYTDNIVWTSVVFAFLAGVFALCSGIFAIAARHHGTEELGATRARIEELQDSLRVDRRWEALPTEKRLKEIQDALGGLRRAE